MMAMPFLPQPKCPAEWWSSNLINKIIKNHRKSTGNPKFPKIPSRRNFRPKFEVGLWSSKNAKTDWVALFFPPTVPCHGHPVVHLFLLRSRGASKRSRAIFSPWFDMSLCTKNPWPTPHAADPNYFLFGSCHFQQDFS